MATDLALAARRCVDDRLAPDACAAVLEPVLVRLFVHEFNNRHSAVQGFAALLRRALAEPGPRAAALAGRLEEAAERTGRLARALAFLTAPPEAGEVEATDILAPVEAIGAPHLLKAAGFSLTCDAQPGVTIPTAGPLAAKLLIYAAGCLAGRGGAFTVRAERAGDRPALAIAFTPGDPAPSPGALAAAGALLRAIPGAAAGAGEDALPARIVFGTAAGR